MKIFKNLLLAGIVWFANFSLSAQTLPLRFGIKGGYNVSNATVNDARGTKSKNGYHIGGTVEYAFSQKFLIQSGLLFSSKGSNIHQLNASHYIPSPPDDIHTFNESYVMLPLHGAYRLNATKEFHIIVGVGPYLGYGVAGKTKQKLNKGAWSDGATKEEWKTFGDGVFDESRDWLHGTTLKRLDVGAGANIDFEYGKYTLGAGYERSLVNIAVQENAPGLQYKNNTIQISIGCKF